ncbi:MAG: hypothetical protein EZS28_004383 [Streblomastix strix]|uniref:U-box domain-containing protein n=1 Tax=Streblomastix strix TaxID=222440 RepID=A0A5J4X0T8_9EUKA|nr:MAG: hypothetical protein EZS28_004383 [Streblomastix strix]
MYPYDPNFNGPKYSEAQMREKDQQIWSQNQQIKQLNDQLSGQQIALTMSVLSPFSYSFDEYIRQCPVNALKLQSKLFDAKLKGKIIKWNAQVVSMWGTSANLLIHPSSGETPYNATLHFTPDTIPENLIPGKSTWIAAKMVNFGDNLNQLQLEAVKESSVNIPDLSITYARIKDLFNPHAQQAAEQLFESWGKAQFSFIGKIKYFNEITNDSNYCAQLEVIVVQPFHDNDLEKVIIIININDIAVISTIKDHPQSHFEFIVTPLVRRENRHELLLQGITQIFSHSFRAQQLPINLIPDNEQLIQRRSASPPNFLYNRWINIVQGNNPIPEFYPMPQPYPIPPIPSPKPYPIPEPYPIPPPIPPFLLPKPPIVIIPPIVKIPPIPVMSDKEEAEHHYICELTAKMMSDPVSVGDNYFERAEIMTYIEQNRFHPLTFDTASISDIKEEPELKAQIERYLKDNPQRRNQTQPKPKPKTVSPDVVIPVPRTINDVPQEEIDRLIKEHAICPITKQTMTNPQLAPDGNVYEYAAVQKYLDDHSFNLPSGVHCELNQLKEDAGAIFSSISFAQENPNHPCVKAGYQEFIQQQQ